MASPFKFETPLQQCGLEKTTHREAEFDMNLLTSVALFRLHSLQDIAVLNQQLAASNIELPASVNQSAGQDPALLCLAPGEWLVFSEYLSSTLLEKQLADAIQPDLTALLDISSSLAAFRLNGYVAPWLLSGLCGLNFHIGSRQGQHCSRTRLDSVPAILHYHQPGSGAGPFVFDVLVERSLAAQAWNVFLERLPHARELQQEHGSYLNGPSLNQP